ncbi:hypothetical protein PHLCEN_2v10487 [Hermanssonia centrifuga]|uniref:Uncharacterized protein n=1 Tax=Hermanssonia centrifuga TaxID=98765 RepID=A0A2R6NMF7_9APHY|nr:hypothetical protein PHLCEN_2v10487 [Hermanssonia centrifuga]
MLKIWVVLNSNPVPLKTVYLAKKARPIQVYHTTQNCMQALTSPQIPACVRK